MLGVGVLLVFGYFSSEGYDCGGMKEFSVGVWSRALSSFSSLSPEVVLHRYLTLTASF